MPRLGKRQAAPFITRSATADARLIFMTTSGTASGTAAAVAAAESWRSACSPCCSSSQRRPARRSTPRGARALPRAYAREHGHHGRERLADLVRLDGAVDGTTVACRRRHCSSCSRFILRATSPGRPHHERHAYAAWGGARALGRTCANTTDRSVHVTSGISGCSTSFPRCHWPLPRAWTRLCWLRLRKRWESISRRRMPKSRGVVFDCPCGCEVVVHVFARDVRRCDCCKCTCTRLAGVLCSSGCAC